MKEKKLLTLLVSLCLALALITLPFMAASAKPALTPGPVTIPAKPKPIQIDPKRTAVIVVDMQNAFCSKGGMFDLVGMLNEKAVARAIAGDKKVIEAARRAGIRVLYFRAALRPDFSNLGGPDSPNYWKPRGSLVAREHPEWKDKCYIIGSWGWEIVDELKPQPGEIVIDKNRYSGFVSTELHTILQTWNIKYLVFLGIATNVCVEATLRDAYHHEYWPIIVEDGCANAGPPFTQEATMWNVQALFGWVTTADEFAQALK